MSHFEEHIGVLDSSEKNAVHQWRHFAIQRGMKPVYPAALKRRNFASDGMVAVCAIANGELLT